MKYPDPIPDTIRVAGTDFGVVISTPYKLVSAGNIGAVNTGDASIWLDASITDWRQRKVLLHELIHASDILYGSGTMTEQQVVSIENGLWAIFNDNHGLSVAIFGDAA